jgi:hypothetical protein
MEPIRYLSPEEAVDHLRQGITLQQWIKVIVRDGFRFIRWVEIGSNDGCWSIYEKESLDDGPGNGDITSFYNDLDPDAPEGVHYSCQSVDEAVQVCMRLGCTSNRFVAFCEIQTLYNAFIATHGPPGRDSREYFLPV